MPGRAATASRCWKTPTATARPTASRSLPRDSTFPRALRWAMAECGWPMRRTSLFLQDTDGDGVADKREVVVTGFGRDDTHELPNSLTWGPDGWLYGLNGVFNASKIEQAGKRHEFTCALFRIHPRTREFQLFAEGTSNPWGVAWDNEGSAFLSACVIDHLWHLAETGYYIRQGGPYPPFTRPMGSIVKHKHQKAAYCGIHYFDSDAYPRRVSRSAVHGQHSRQLHQRRRAVAPRLDVRRHGRARFSGGQRRLVHAGGAKDRPRWLPVRAGLVRSVPLLPGCAPRSRGHRPAQRPAVSHSLSRHAPGRAVRPGGRERRRN